MKRIILGLILFYSIATNAQSYIIAVDGVDPSLSQTQARQELAQGKPYVGQIMLFDDEQIPYGWRECNGDTLEILDFISLFSVIGNQYGGDGIDNFCLPKISNANYSSFSNDWNIRWDSVRNNVVEFNETILAPVIEVDQELLTPKLVVDEIQLADQLLVGGSEDGGNSGEVLMKRSSELVYDSLQVTDIKGRYKIPLVDTLNGRAVFVIDEPSASLIPDSSHFVIEADYVKVWQVNTAFATVPAGYNVVSVGLDSTELTLQKPNYDITYEIFCTCFDDTIIGYYDTIPYKVGIYNTTDTITLYKAQSILFFSDTIWANVGDNYKFTNYISNSHPMTQFRRSSNSLGATILWDNKQKKFFVQ